MEEKNNIPGFREELLKEPYVKWLHEQLYAYVGQVESLKKKVEELESEIRKLKGLPSKPNIKPSKLDEPQQENEKDNAENRTEKRPGSEKRHKKETLEIHEQKEVKAEGVPVDWKLSGYKSVVIQDLLIRANNTEYCLEIWKSPDGSQQIEAQLPKHLENTHFGPVLKAYILHQYHECAVSQPLIYSSLVEFGVDISTGQINAILTEDKDEFHEEKKSVLSKGLEMDEQIQTDDTGARHQFKNGFCNCITGELFTHFETTNSKSRINFLQILRQDRTDYRINKEALDYVLHQELSPKYVEILRTSYQKGETVLKDKTELEDYFKRNQIQAAYAQRTITEALLIGSLIEHGFDPNKVIHSDGAPQFNLFVHALCWKHAERPLVSLKTYNPVQHTQLEEKKTAYWSLYQDLKTFKVTPDPTLVEPLKAKFDLLCSPINNFSPLNSVLEDLKSKKDQLLLVLTRHRTPLHNNDTERDIREYVKRRKISAGTRSELGRLARDTFLSLKKTCRKLGISFWKYLLDRLQNTNLIPPLSHVMQLKANSR
jgi:hypothetical protein